MELPGIFKGLGERISRVGGNKVTFEPPKDPRTTAALEARSKGMLVRFYTDPDSLQNLGSAGVAMGNFHRAGEELTRMEGELGVNTNAVPHLTNNLQTEMGIAAEIISKNREQALSIVAANRRAAVDHDALLEAKRQLAEKLQQEGLSRSYRIGATEMLRRIEDQLKERTALPEANPIPK